MIPAARRTAILALMKEQGAVSVDELAERFAVSVITIRRDLDALGEQGLLERTHGGAIRPPFVGKETAYRDKMRARRAEKREIASAAAALVEEGDTVFINSGSTTRQVIEILAEMPGIRIVTNNLQAVSEIEHEARAEIYLVGGLVRGSSGCSVGPFGEDMVGRINGSKAILGADAFSARIGLTSPVSEEASLTRCMIRQTDGPVIVAADSSKIERVTSFHEADPAEVDYLITDGPIPDEERAVWERAGVRVVETEQDGGVPKEE